MNANSSKLKSAFQDDPDIMRALEAKGNRDMLAKLVEQKENPSMDVMVKSLRAIFKGDDGAVPEKGKDYFTEDELDEIKKSITPEKFKDYYTEEEVQHIYSLLVKALDERIDGLKEKITPKKGVDYFDGNDGTNGIDGGIPTEEQLLKLIRPLIPQVADGKDGSVTTVDEVLEKILSLEGEDAARFGRAMGAKIDISQIRNAQSFMMKGSKSKYKFEELMHGAGTGGGSTANILTQYNLTATQDGADALVALSQLTNFATLVGVIVAYHNQIPQTQGTTCDITGTQVRFYNADASDVFSITYTFA